MDLSLNTGFQLSGLPGFTGSGVSLGLWFKLNAFPWDVDKDMVLLETSNSFMKCVLTKTKLLRCYQYQNNPSSMFEIELTTSSTHLIETGQWYFLLITGDSQQAYLKLYDLSMSQILLSQRVTNFNINFNMNGRFDMRIGVGSDLNNGIEGSIRQVSMIQMFISTQQDLIDLAFTKPSNNLKMHLTLFNMKDGLVEQVSNIRASSIGWSNKQGIFPKLDLLTQVYCRQGGTWDGVACSESFKAIQFLKQDSYAESQFSVGNIGDTVDGITVEFWFKPTIGSQTGVLFTLQSDQGDMLQIRVDSDQKLRCYLKPEDKVSTLNSLIYQDFDLGDTDWLHISCTVNQYKQALQGTLYKFTSKPKEYTYEQDASSFISQFSLKQTYDGQKFQVFLNNDKTRYKGQTQIYYADFRLWKSAKSFDFILDSKNQLVDYQASQPDLLSALLLINDQTVIDFAQATFHEVTYQNEIGDFDYFPQKAFLSNTKLQEVSRLLLCPVMTYAHISSNSVKCLRDGIESLQFNVFKEETGNYSITIMNSKIISDYVQNHFSEIFSFKWEVITLPNGMPTELAKIFKQFLDSTKGPSFFFPKDFLFFEDQFTFSLTIKDMKYNQQPILRQEMPFVPSHCYKFYTLPNKKVQSVVTYLQQKGSTDQFLKYGFEQCSKWDSVTVTTRLLKDKYADQNIQIGTWNNDQLIVTKDAQNMFSLNEDIYLLVTAQWPGYRTALSVIYTLKFASQVQLKIKASGDFVSKVSPPIIVMQNGLDAVNYDLKQFPIQSFQWVCPPNLCLDTTKTQLNLTLQDFERANIKDWEKASITGKIPFTFSDGTLVSFQTVEIYKVPFDQQIKIIGDSLETIFSNQELNIRLQASVDLNNVAVEWSSVPQISDQLLLNGRANQLFQVKPDVLPPETLFNFTVKLIIKRNNFVLWTGHKQIKVNTPPKPGDLLVSPSSGTALETIFKINATDWFVQIRPALYQFSFTDKKGRQFKLTHYQTKSSFETYLPDVSEISVTVTDGSGVKQRKSVKVDCMVTANLPVAKFQQIYNESFKQLSIVQKLSSLSILAKTFGSLTNQNQKEAAMKVGDQILKFIETQENDIPVFEPKYQALIIESFVSIYWFLLEQSQPLSLDLMQNILNKLQEFLTKHNDSFQIRSPGDIDFEVNMYGAVSSILKTLYYYINQGYFKQLGFGWKEKTLMKATHQMRQILELTEQSMSIQMQNNQDYNYDSEAFKVKSRKFTESTLQQFVASLKDGQWGDTIQSLKVSVPLNHLKFKTRMQSLTLIIFKLNPFVGSYYFNFENVRQEVTANQSLFIAFRDENGNFLDSSVTQSRIQFELMDYHYNITALNETFERLITRCAYMVTGDTIIKSVFGYKQCDTENQYDFGKIACSCYPMNFMTITRDEFEIPLGDDMSFNFQNWASLAVFTYLTLILIFGFQFAQNYDQRDLAKLNDIEGDSTEFTGIEQMEIQFPVQAYALKRQVYLMSFASEELTAVKLFLIIVSQFHPFFTFKNRFDPCITRTDRFLLFFTQLSLICIFSFLMFRNSDMPNPDTGRFDFEPGVLTLPIIFTFIFSLLVVSPLPSIVTSLIETKYVLQGVDYEFNDNGLQDEFENNNTSASEGTSLKQLQKDINEPDEAPNVKADPNVPLKYLFQLAAFKLNYIAKRLTQNRKFKFLNVPRKDIMNQIKVDQEDIVVEQKATAVKEQKKREIEKQKRDEKRQQMMEKQRKKEERKAKKAAKEEKKKREEMEKWKYGSARSTDKLLGHSSPPKVSGILQSIRGEPLQLQEIELEMQEGGDEEEEKDSDKSSIKSDDMKEVNNEFLEDVSASNLKLKRARFGIIALNALIYVVLLIIYSQEGIHSEPGRIIWVIVFFLAQIVACFLTLPLWMYLLSVAIVKRHKDTLFWCKHFYELYILVEDYDQVHKFLNKKFN